MPMPRFDRSERTLTAIAERSIVTLPFCVEITVPPPVSAFFTCVCARRLASFHNCRNCSDWKNRNVASWVKVFSPPASGPARNEIFGGRFSFASSSTSTFSKRVFVIRTETALMMSWFSASGATVRT